MEPELMNKVKYLFGVRKGFSSRPPGLLIVDRSGVYSTAHRRYIRKTRYHRYRALAMDLGPVVKAYRLLEKLETKSSPEHDEGRARKVMTWWKHRVMGLLEKLGTKSSPEHDEGRARKVMTWWKHRVMDVYWHAAPEKRKVIAMERYARYQRGILYPFMALGVGLDIVGCTHSMLLGRFEISFQLVVMFVGICLAGSYLIVTTERSIPVRHALSRSQIHDILELELTSK